MSQAPAELRSAIAEFVRHDRSLVASDFDGVLAPLVDDPASSRPLPGAVEALIDLGRQPGTFAALVSGRDLATLGRLTRLGADDGVALIGSHGAESSEPLALSTELGAAGSARLAAATDALVTIAQRHRPARVEHKAAGVVLHTRGIPARVAEAATAEALRVPQQIAGVRAMHGKDVVELTVLDVSKGLALKALSRICRAEALLYCGDDVTDETVFAMARPGLDVTVKVGDGTTAAAYRVADPHAAVELLAHVAESRRALLR